MERSILKADSKNFNHKRWFRLGVFLFITMICHGMGWNVVQAEEKTESTESLININTATAAELATLKGIGPSKAEAIVKKREKIGKFKRIEAIMRVKGIGRGTFQKIKHRLTVGNEGKK